MGFLNQFQPYAIRVMDAVNRDVCITLSRTGQLIAIPGIAYQWHPIMSPGTSLSPEDAEWKVVTRRERGPVQEHITWQPEPQSRTDLHHRGIVSNFRQDSPARPLLNWAGRRGGHLRGTRAPR